jgi:hypothetical protein
MYLLTTFSKVFEKIIYHGLIENIQISNIQVEEQLGCRTLSSTEKAALN